MANAPSDPRPSRPGLGRRAARRLGALLAALGLSAGATAQPASEAPVIARLDAIRQRLLAQDAAAEPGAAADEPGEVGQWFNWPNWANWSKWTNWNNWNNWGKL